MDAVAPSRLDQDQKPTTSRWLAMLAGAARGSVMVSDGLALFGLSRAEQTALTQATLFQGLGDDALGRLLAGAGIAALAQGQSLFLQDEPADRFFLVLSGWIRLYRLGDDGSEATVSVVGAGETFAEAASFAAAVYPVCADAVAPARVLCLAKKAFEEAIAADGTIALRMLASLSHRLRRLVVQIEQLQVKSAPQRLAAFLVGLSPRLAGAVTFVLPLPKALIAQRLGMRPETLSRAFAALRRQGVGRRGNEVSIADVAALVRFASDGRSAGCC
jgi:CRP-like cAMP-binding protein